MSTTTEETTTTRNALAYKILLATLRNSNYWSTRYGPARADAARASEAFRLLLQKIEDLVAARVDDPDVAAQRVWDEVGPLYMQMFEQVRVESHPQVIENFIATLRAGLDGSDG